MSDKQKKSNKTNIPKEFTKNITKFASPRKKKRGPLGRVNPFLMLIISVVGIFVFIGIYNQAVSIRNASLGELIAGLESNKYAELLIQNDGSIVAREKEYYVVTDSLNNTDDSILKTSQISNGSLKPVQFEEITDLFETKSLVTQIRSIFSDNETQIIEILFGEDYTLVLTDKSSPDYIIEGLDKNEFQEKLDDNNIDLDSLGIYSKELRIYAKELGQDSALKRIDEDQIIHKITTDDISLLRVEPNKVSSVKIDWTPSIFTFTELLQNEDFSLSSEEATFIVDTRSVADGLNLDTILTLITIGAFIFLGYVIFRSAQSSGMGIMQFGQSKAKMFFGKKTGVTFKDVAGIDEAREELNEIVDFLRNPMKYRKLGARIPKGILMFGPPGTGKTLLARAIAGEAGVPFFHTSGSEFEEMLVGAGASRVRDLFAKAKKAAPSLIFIDEIDAVARKRGTRIQSGSTEQTLNQILVEMDGFEPNINVIVIAATNRPDVLDGAILRPGRFDRQVRIEPPDKDGRVEILKIHSNNKPLEKSVDLERIAKRTVGFTGADLENIMNEAAIIAAKDNRSEITNQDVDDSVSKVVLGPAKKSRKRTEEEIKLVAYHEAGHALVAKMTEGSIPVDKISIVSRGSSGGVTMFLPEKDENIISMKRLLANIIVSLGGRAAEEIVMDDISTGASNDIEQATRTVKNMIQKYGMSKSLGLVKYGTSSESEYLGYQYNDSADYSEETAKLIDTEVREVIADSYKKALEVIKNNRAKLDEIAELLMEKEVLEKDEFDKLFP